MTLLPLNDFAGFLVTYIFLLMNYNLQTKYLDTTACTRFLKDTPACSYRQNLYWGNSGKWCKDEWCNILGRNVGSDWYIHVLNMTTLICLKNEHDHTNLFYLVWFIWDDSWYWKLSDLILTNYNLILPTAMIALSLISSSEWFAKYKLISKTCKLIAF